MTKKYRSQGVNFNIAVVEIERETDVSVWIDGQRHAKRSSWTNYFDTWAEAQAYRTNVAQGDIDWAQDKLNRAKARLAKVVAEKPPE